MYMYTYMYRHVCIHIYIYISFVYICIYAHIHTYVYVHVTLGFGNGVGIVCVRTCVRVVHEFAYMYILWICLRMVGDGLSSIRRHLLTDRRSQTRASRKDASTVFCHQKDGEPSEGIPTRKHVPRNAISETSAYLCIYIYIYTYTYNMYIYVYIYIYV